MTTAILFPHHHNDHLTNSHLAIMRRSNPGVDVIPITDGDGECVTGGHHLGDVPYRLPFRDVQGKRNGWYFCDQLLCKALTHFTKYDRYIWLEYDTYCTQSVGDAYADVWDDDIAGHKVLTPENCPNWHWWRDLPYLSKRYLLGGIGPLEGLFLSRHGADKLLAHMPYEPVFCELRVGISIRQSGVPYKQLPDALRITQRWDAFKGDISKPGIYHSVKKLVP